MAGDGGAISGTWCQVRRYDESAAVEVSGEGRGQTRDQNQKPDCRVPESCRERQQFTSYRVDEASSPPAAPVNVGCVSAKSGMGAVAAVG